MADVLDFQDQNPEEVPGEEKASHISHYLCRNSYASQRLCWKW